MTDTIAFRNLPFVPEPNQVIYVESGFDPAINAHIEEKYHILCNTLTDIGLEFVYLPLHFGKDRKLEEKVRYYAPYITTEIVQDRSIGSDFMLRYLSDKELASSVSPCLLHSPVQADDEWVFQVHPIEKDANIRREFLNLIRSNNPLFQHNISSGFSAPQCSQSIPEDDAPRPSISKWRKTTAGWFGTVCHFSCDDLDDEPCSISLQEEHDEEEDEILGMLEDLENTIRKLHLRGISLGAIHEFIDKQETISRLVITDDLRIFLPEYNNMEIEMSAQIKALYFLFLNHPEGIVLQHLEEYHNELVNYYKQTSKVPLTPKKIDGIKRLEEYGNNQLNVLITRIRELFCSKFDERLAKHYVISGEKGGRYSIPLDRLLVEWKE